MKSFDINVTSHFDDILGSKGFSGLGIPVSLRLPPSLSITSGIMST